MYQSAYTLLPHTLQKGVRALGSSATAFCRVILRFLLPHPPRILRTPFCIASFQKGARTSGQTCGRFCRVILRFSPVEPPRFLRTPFCGAVAVARRSTGGTAVPCAREAGVGHKPQTSAGPVPAARLGRCRTFGALVVHMRRRSTGRKWPHRRSALGLPARTAQKRCGYLCGYFGTFREKPTAPDLVFT